MTPHHLGRHDEMRKVEQESDEELPSLEDLAKPGIKGKSRALKKPTAEKMSTDGVGSVRNQGPNIGGEIEIRESKKGGKANEEKIKKKRVLNSKGDNPLLRPLNMKEMSFKSSQKGGRRNNESSRDGGMGSDQFVRARRMSRSKSRSVTPLGDLGLGEEKAVARNPESKTATEKRVVSGKSEFLSKTKNLDVSSAREAISEKSQGSNPESRRAVESRPTKRVPIETESESEEHYDSDGLSDFVVDDSSFLEEAISIMEMPPPPPRSTRKLVPRRQVKKEDTDDDDLDLELWKLNIKDDDSKRGSTIVSKDKDLEAFARDFPVDEDVPVKNSSIPRKLFEDVRIEPPRRTKEVLPKKKCEVASSDIEDSFTLQYSPSESKLKKISKQTKFVTPPPSPERKPLGLKSPTKGLPRVPPTPHRESMDAFWQQDVVNDWNEHFSPQKTPKARPKLPDNNTSDSTLITSPKKSPTKKDQAAREAKKQFSLRKHEIASTFLAELDTKITSGQISQLSASTGGVKIIWSKKLNTTAGRANWKRETLKPTSLLPNGDPKPPIYRHHASIELAEKVIDDEHRLLNVIAHEFCHLANFMITNKKDNPHGKEFKAWASLCSTHFSHREIEVTTKHSYVIDYKYIWECVSCAAEYKRHSKSIDPKRHTCGSCKSKLVQVKPVPRVAKEGEGRVNEYQVFVRENMKKVREENPGSPQKEIMGLVGKRYQEFKASKLDGTVAVEEVAEEVVDVGEDEVEGVVRKLDFLDLTSP